MDSKLDPVFRAVFRHAESLDTRLGIRREEPQNDQNRRRDDRRPARDGESWQDITVVSVQALRVFLRGLVDSNVTPPAAVPDTPAPPRPADPAAAHAADAYRNTARHTEPPAAPPRPADSPATAALMPTLTPDDIRAIHALLDDLEILAARGVEELRIEKSGSFLESLRAAAQTARNGAARA